MSEETESGFRGHCLVEVMGHQRLAGYVTEQDIAGTGFLRVDVPAVAGRQAFTRFIGPKSIHSLSPVSEEVALALAANLQETPVSEWQIRQGQKLLEQQPGDDRCDDDDDVDYGDIF